MKVYTKTGDKGTTGLYTGERIAKDSLRVEAYGTVDEITSVLGLARSQCQNSSVVSTIYDVQKLLMSVMAQLASLGECHYITNEHIKLLEKTIDDIDAKLPPLTAFLIPGDSIGSACLDQARTVTRRAERQVLRLSHEEVVDESLLVFLNRLSDLCFVLSRMENFQEG
ncbi:cob(I)alamin adenosyltransferase [Sporomusaceae bacterium BoRhaA]|jgi:cob(I)alamin adenosyltransferase|uniref:cob(I)yrinic acid a,c-diamide adenosyltransferase n=1 Tax=Pelorhabdus rhamnosifermentans TaxID=2772457 RepID=UPI001C0615A2|nr:cob(I)yrinic acid a,c-diamide adenosyltransferase [Pelorhabdus rhamnosifermentans]MBU2701083.1 cob(I)alamin adenosyltransferase [Pelorhabdus rhamnosifermentans]